MGRIIEIIVLVVLIVITAYYYVKARKESYEKAKEADAAKAAMKNEEVKFVLTAKIDGMMCGKCAARVTECLNKFGTVEINLEEKTATITSDALVDVVELENTITELGYKFEGIVE